MDDRYAKDIAKELKLIRKELQNKDVKSNELSKEEGLQFNQLK